MKKLTRVVSIAAAAAMMFGMSACGNSGSNNAGNTEGGNVALTVWGPSEDQAKNNSWLQTMEKNFEKANPKVPRSSSRGRML